MTPFEEHTVYFHDGKRIMFCYRHAMFNNTTLPMSLASELRRLVRVELKANSLTLKTFAERIAIFAGFYEEGVADKSKRLSKRLNRLRLSIDEVWTKARLYPGSQANPRSVSAFDAWLIIGALCDSEITPELSCDTSALSHLLEDVSSFDKRSEQQRALDEAEDGPIEYGLVPLLVPHGHEDDVALALASTLRNAGVISLKKVEAARAAIAETLVASAPEFAYEAAALVGSRLVDRGYSSSDTFRADPTDTDFWYLVVMNIFHMATGTLFADDETA